MIYSQLRRTENYYCMDFETPLEESMMALDSAVKSGKALYAGISNYDREHTKKAIEILKDLRCPFIINQSSYSIFNRRIEEDGLKTFAAENGCGIITFSPLDQGMLTDKYLKGIPIDSRIWKDGRFLTEKSLMPKRLKQIGDLNEIARNRGQSLAQMALSWILKDKDITSVLIGASKPEQILENVKLVDNIVFTEDELNQIEGIIRK